MVSLMFAARNPDVDIVQDETNASPMPSCNTRSFTSCGKMCMLFRGLGPQSQVDTDRL